MFFLDTNNTSVGSDLLRTLCMWLCGAVYRLIAWIYSLFMKFADINLMNTKDASETISNIYSRIEILLIIFMLFVVVFNLIKMLIDPELMTNKEQGLSNIAKRAVISVALLALVPYAFDIAYEVQDKVVKGNVIEKIVLGNAAEGIETSNFGNEFAADMFLMFYKVNSDLDNATAKCDNITDQDIHNYISIYGNLDIAYNCLNKKTATTEELLEGTKSYIIDFDGLTAVVCGVFILVMATSYVISLAIRMFQLAFLQIIAPIPIMTYIIPKKDGTFNKWVKACITTYIDVFIRMAILYFFILVISLVLDSPVFADDNLGLIAKIIVVSGLVAFCNRAPKLIQELFPSSGGAASLGFGLQGLKDAPTGRIIGGAVGAAGGSIIGAAHRFKTNRNAGKGIAKSLAGSAFGAVSGFGSGLMHGSKKGNMFNNLKTAYDKRLASDDKYTTLISGGGSTLGAIRSRWQATFGETDAQENNRKLRDLERLAQCKKDMYAAADEIEPVKSLKSVWDKAVQREGETEEQFRARKTNYYNQYKAARNAVAAQALLAAQTGEYVPIKNLKVSYEGYETDAKGNVILGDDGKPIKKTMPGEFTIDVDLSDSDNKAHASAIETARIRANEEIKSRKIKRYDKDKKDWVEVEEIKAPDTQEAAAAARSAMGELETYSTQSRAQVQAEGQARAEANDTGAGVDPNGSKK